jgi:LuxR family maltose regulon positive regulatory protein
MRGGAALVSEVLSKNKTPQHEALAIHRQGRLDESLDVLEQAVAMAEPDGWIRPFVECGLQMFNLLKGVRKRNVAVDYIDKLLAAFRDDQQVAGTEPFGHPNASPHQPLRPSIPSQPLVEPLTNRELDVLELLAKRLQNKEIADKLFISTGTVKGHLKSIYQKLSVGKRREAVSKAIDLGIIRRR